MTIFLRNSAGTVRGSGVFSRSTQGSAALFWRAVQCRLILRSMVFRKGGVLYLFGTMLERAFQRCMGWGGVGTICLRNWAGRSRVVSSLDLSISRHQEHATKRKKAGIAATYH